ncbi:hypothetical protein NIES4102_07530 [Chondrocystis sp. NIES-4102]|nr:hypothetical protein NIES4102_07530 [Chondrocystis sp. NIES-4102]
MKVLLLMHHQELTISQFNQMSQGDFTATLGEIWEQTPEIARKAKQSN